MKIEILKDHFESAVSAAARVGNKNLSLAVLGCALIHATPERVSLRATNLDVSIEILLKAKVIESGMVAVPAQTLNQLVSAFSGEKLNLELQGTTLLLQEGHGTSKLKTLDASEFPTLPYVKEGEGHAFTLSVKDLSRALKSVAFAAAGSGMRPELSSIFLKVENSTLVAAATDSFRLSEIRIPIRSKEHADAILLPVRNVQEIVRVISSGGDTVEMRVGENQVTCIANGSYITSRIVDGAFPEYSAIIPKDFSGTATVLTEDLTRTLRKVSVFTDATGEVQFSLNPKEKVFTISATNASVGETKETIEGSLEGEPVTLSFNIRYILEALSVINSDSTILKFSGPGRPLIVSESPDKGFTYLVMPMNR